MVILNLALPHSTPSRSMKRDVASDIRGIFMEVHIYGFIWNAWGIYQSTAMVFTNRRKIVQINPWTKSTVHYLKQIWVLRNHDKSWILWSFSSNPTSEYDYDIDHVAPQICSNWGCFAATWATWSWKPWWDSGLFHRVSYWNVFDFFTIFNIIYGLDNSW